ncbi:MAG: succinylglutamate desuccinylase/aspartoacylase family protein [Planctomycetes bacterium]|nr:succinylglutamate desuccinylase/aspartoacylase family protein [Planctomycetota bacterium]
MTRITTDVDFERDGTQRGFLRLPHSVHRSAYGWIAIPIVVVKNGSGSTVLLTAGNHGDEYEGQLALMKLCQELEPEAVRGRVIMLPAANYPAAIAGLRTSPIDDLNLNRSFPGDADGRPTEAIAHYIETELLSLADFAVDLHSGGSSLMYLTSSLATPPTDSQLAPVQRELLLAFTAPIAYFAHPGGEDRTMLAAANRAGVPAIGTELGGSGSASVHSVAVAERGVRRVLKHVGAVPDIDVGEDVPPSRLMEVRGFADYVYSPEYGLWEPLVELGDEVQAGQPAAAVYCQQTPWREPVTAHFEQSGKVICRRVPGPVERGDCLFHLAADCS